MDIKFKNDKYKKTRGGVSALLDIKCAHCGSHLFYYQKDGPGALKRMYTDRIYEFGNVDLNKSLFCPKCRSLIAISMIYKKENRKALRLFVGAVKKSKIKWF
jgi:hypothetical protein